MAADLALSRNGAGPSDGDLGLAGLAISRNIVDHGLPPLGSRGASSSSAHYDSSRLPATVKEGVLEIALGPALARRHATRLWHDVDENPQALDWGSEKDIQRYVVLALKDVLSAAGLGSSVSVQEDLTMFSVNSRQQKSDVYLVKQKMVPIGVVEVKKPTEGVFDIPQVNGQIYDYMMTLRSFSGLKYVFGILTTYEQWRVCWLEDADLPAQAKSLPAPVERRFQLWPYLPPAPRWLVTTDLPAQRTVTPPPAAPRAFHATKLYDCTDTALTAVLVSAVRKMERSPVTQPATIDALLVGTGLLANAAILHWAQKSLSKVEFGVELTVEDKEFWLLADLHGGADGNVWLASTPRGKGCIVKFSRRSGDEAREACAREASIWTTVWRRNAFALQLGGNAAVVMPYVKPCAGSGDAFEPPAPLKAATKAAIATLSRHGKRHDDLKWSHVGKYLDACGREKVVLFDLAQVSENVQPEDAKRSMEEALGLAQG